METESGREWLGMGAGGGVSTGVIATGPGSRIAAVPRLSLPPSPSPPGPSPPPAAHPEHPEGGSERTHGVGAAAPCPGVHHARGALPVTGVIPVPPLHLAHAPPPPRHPSLPPLCPPHRDGEGH